MLTLTLLGTFVAYVDERQQPLRLPTQKSVGLLAYLALRRERVSRDVLSSLLWNDVPPQQARHSLRQELTHIRTALGANARDYVYADRSVVGLNLQAINVDAEQLMELVARHTPESLRQACALYRGPLLNGVRTREQAFDAWLDATRADLNRLVVIALEHCVDQYAASGETDEAVRLARQLMAIDASNETAQRRLLATHGS